MKKSTKSLILAGLAVIMLTMQSSAQVTLNLRVYLEGPFNGASMNTDLNVQSLIPLNQPYNSAPWNYNGTELVASIPNISIVDWVLIELRETTGDASTATPDKIIGRKAVFIKSDGRLVDLDGASFPELPGTVTNNLYVVIYHRNHLAVMSSGPLIYFAGHYSWNFTGQQSKAYLNGHKEIAPGIFGMMGGDCDGSGRTIQNDKILCWEDRAGFYGYFSSDLNLDGQVDNGDKDWVYVPNIGQSAQLPEGIAWECGMDITDSRDGQIYSTVQIGEQCWMAENLNVGNRINAEIQMADNGVIEKYCYLNEEDTCSEYGGLYQWQEVMQYQSATGSQGICPSGWHVPTANEYTKLQTFLSGGLTACNRMRETGSRHWQYPNPEANNSSGFGCFAGGCSRFTDPGDFYGLMGAAFFWTSSTLDFNTYSVYQVLGESEIFQNNDLITRGASVRCIKDSLTHPWSCGDPLIDPRDNQSYNTVQIGEQCWMAENLNIGTSIPATQSQSDNSMIEKYCYNGTQDSCDVYGGLYQWNEMMQYDTVSGRRGICLSGWHLPTDEEWKQLEGAADSQFGYPDNEWNATGFRGFDAGKNLKSTNKWVANGHGVDLFGFNVLPGGNVSLEQLYDNSGEWADFWTSSFQSPSGWGISRDFGHLSDESWRDMGPTDYAFSVRCIKNTEPLPWSCGDPLIDTRDDQSYTTVQIGDHCWMAENLNIGTRVNGVNNQSNNSIVEKYCYSDLESNCSEYGGLYQWNEMMEYSLAEISKGICPDGWHVPSEPEWCEMLTSIDPTVDCNAFGWFTGTDVGFKMKADYSWNGSGNGSNESGFSALGIGNRSTDTYYYDLGNNSHMWTSNAGYGNNARLWVLDFSMNNILHYELDANFGFGVRCVKDSEPVSWSCGDPIIDTRDNQSYTTVQIGDQCWMAENLNVGDIVLPYEQSNNSIIEKLCYNNTATNCDEYGGLYEWNEMMNYSGAENSQGICPAGWHVPGLGDWDILIQSSGGASVAGGKLKETGYIHWVEPNTGATNESGFTAFGSGKYEDGYGLLNQYGSYWTSFFNGEDQFLKYVRYNSGSIETGYSYFEYSNCNAVRCIKDNEPTWGCGDPIIDNRDNQSYNTVQIGEQCWMAENLNTGTMITGITEMTDNSMIEKYCYNNITDNCETYGGLYQWDEAMQYTIQEGSQGICPANWHLPADTEWLSLTNYLGGENNAGGKVKTIGTSEGGTGLWHSPNTGATNESGFSATPGGIANEGDFFNLGYLAHFWSSTENDEVSAWYRLLYYYNTLVSRDTDSRIYGFSVRCVQD
jgi:uncharacterized protein (TIGR02145 family)